MGDILVKAPEDDDPSKFMQGTDMRTSAAKRAEILRRMRENPGYLDSIMDLNGIDKELAYRVKATQNLSMDEFLDRLINTVQGEGQGLPLIATEGEVSAEQRKDSRDRRIAVRQAAETGDREEPNIVRDKEGRDIGRTFAPMGDTRELETDEINEVKQKIREGQVGVKGLSEQQRVRDKILEEEGVKLTGQGKYVKITPPQEADTNPLRDASDEELERQSARFAVQDTKGDKMERLKKKEQAILDQLEGRKRVLRPRGSGRFQEMRGGLQDELEKPLSDVDERLGSFSRYKLDTLNRLRGALENPESARQEKELKDAIAALEGPQDPTLRNLTPSQQANLGDTGVERRPFKEGEREEYERLRDLSSQYERELRESYQSELANLAQTRGERKRDIREGGALAEQLESEGLGVPEHNKYFQRVINRRTGEVVRDHGEERNAKGTILQMMNDDENYMNYFQKLALALGLDLSKEQDAVDFYRERGFGENELREDANNLGNLLKPQLQSAYGKRVRRRFTGTPEQLEIQNFVMGKIAEYVAEHEDIDKLNEFLPRGLEIAPKTLSRNEQADLKEQLERVRRNIKTEQDNLDFLSRRSLSDEEVAEMGRQSQLRGEEKREQFKDRNINQMLPMVIANHPQKQLVREQIQNLRNQGRNNVAEIRQRNLDRDMKEEFDRLRKPLEEALDDLLGRIDTAIEGGETNIQIPTASDERLPEMTAFTGTTARSPKPVASVKVLEDKLEQAERMGDEAEVEKLRAQIQREKEQNVIRAGKEGDPDFGRESYTHYTTDQRTDLTSAKTKTRPSGFRVPNKVRGMSENEKVEHALGVLLDDHEQAVKEGKMSFIDKWNVGEKGSLEVLYRNVLRNRPGGSPLQNIDDFDDEEEARRNINQEMPQTAAGIRPQTAGGAASIGQAAPLSELERKIRQRGQRRVQEQYTPEKNPLLDEKELDQRIKDKGFEENRPELVQSVLNRDLAELGIRPTPKTESPFTQEPPPPQLPPLEPTPQPPPQMPAPQMPAPQMPAPQMPAPEPQMPAPEPAPQMPNPFAGVPELNPQQPPITTGSPVITPEMFAAMTTQQQADALNRMSPEQLNQFLATQNLQKSKTMLNFNATKGDQLIKSLKDMMWRQGY